MQTTDNEVKQESQATDQSNQKPPSNSRFNEAEYKRWSERIRDLRFSKPTQA